MFELSLKTYTWHESVKKEHGLISKKVLKEIYYYYAVCQLIWLINHFKVLLFYYSFFSVKWVGVVLLLLFSWLFFSTLSLFGVQNSHIYVRMPQCILPSSLLIPATIHSSVRLYVFDYLLQCHVCWWFSTYNKYVFAKIYKYIYIMCCMK